MYPCHKGPLQEVTQSRMYIEKRGPIAKAEIGPPAITPHNPGNVWPRTYCPLIRVKGNVTVWLSSPLLVFFCFCDSEEGGLWSSGEQGFGGMNQHQEGDL